MDLEQYYLSKIAEEASQVVQSAMKAQQFGLDEIQSGQLYDNKERLIAEFYDLLIAFEIFLDEHCGEDINITTDVKLARHEKMSRLLSYSMELGKVEKQPIYLGKDQ